jgi:outer membrane lipoprotein SlyB
VLRALVGSVLAVALLAGCGETGNATAPATSSAAPIALAVRYDDGAGRVRSGRLTCAAGDQRATGALAGGPPAARLCTQARAIAPLLTKRRPARVACTQIYGGPQTLRVTGTIDGRAVKRRFARTNGCEIADYGRVAGALPAT